MQEHSIRMIRPHLNDLPALVVPEGYSLRTAWPGYEETWVQIINAAFAGTDDWTVEQCREKFTSRPQFDPAGMFFACAGEVPVGTAFAWRDEPGERVWGRVHWVGVVPQHQGQGLGRALVTAVLHYLARHEFPKAFLDTENFRVPAIRLYLSLGFEPYPRDKQEEAVWQDIMTRLGH